MRALTEYLPKPTTWFQNTLRFTGRGRIEFSQPQGWVEGTVIWEVSQLGETTIELSVDTWENSEDDGDKKSISSRDWLISGFRPPKESSWIRMYAIPQPTKNAIVSFGLQCEDGGTWTSISVPSYSWNPITNIIRPYPTMSTYLASNQTKDNARYWVIPCINLDLGLTFGITRSHVYSNLRRHPLRIYPVPENTDKFLMSDAPDHDKAWVRHGLEAISRVVGFIYNDEPAFIERLNDYTKIIEALREGKPRLDVTSLMVGRYVSEIDEKRPIDLLPVLGLATGRPVGASWIEFRDQLGNLVYRFHANFGRYPFERGRPVVSDDIHRGGVGKLLTAAARSPVISDSRIRGALQNCAKSSSGTDATLIFYNAFTGLDEVFTHYRIEQQIHPLKKFLTPIQINDIEAILQKAKSDIELLKARIQQSNAIEGKKQAETIDKVAGRVLSMPLDKRTRFGDRLVALAEHLGFHDIEVLSNYYPNIEQWINKVDFYRNSTMHATHYGNVHDQSARQDFEQITPHLLDLLIRALLKTIGYEGHYAPFVSFPNDSEEVDWVTTSTSPAQLGYM